MRHFCTYFDSGYLTRGLALYESLCRWAGNFQLWVLCFDKVAAEVLDELSLPHLRLVRLDELEAADPDYFATKGTRSKIEYYFTASPCWPRYIQRHLRDNELVTYLDADLYFYSSLDPMFAELGDKSILLAEHRFPNPSPADLAHGRYNVGLLSFRNDGQGIACLERWRSQCLDWCYDSVESGRYADQGYLDEWPFLYSAAVVLQNPGAAVAPWNVLSHVVEARNGSLVVNRASPLIFYHFHGLKSLRSGVFEHGLAPYAASMTSALRNYVYLPYIKELTRQSERVSELRPDLNLSLQTRVGRAKVGSTALIGRYLLGQILFAGDSDARLSSVANAVGDLIPSAMLRRLKRRLAG